jgi:hypothetical protein
VANSYDKQEATLSDKKQNSGVEDMGVHRIWERRGVTVNTSDDYHL